MLRQNPQDQSMYRPGLYPPALEPAPIDWNPGSQYAPETRMWQGCPTIARTRGGIVWAGWYTGGVREPDENNCNLLFRISDIRQPFHDAPFIAINSAPAACLRAMDIQLWVDTLGRLWVFWTQTRDSAAKDTLGRNLLYTDRIFGTFAIICGDPDAEHPVFSTPRRLCDGFLRCRPTVLQSGRWIMCPYDWISSDRTQGRLAYCLSDDQGENWVRRYGPARLGETIFDEQMVAQLLDGRLWMLARTRAGELGECFSADDGLTWTESAPSGIANPSSRFWIDRLHSGRLLLVNHFGFTGRSHMTALLSEDDGKTWPYRLLLDARSGVSYPDAFEAPDGLVTVLYDCGRTKEKEICLAQFREADILAGHVVSQDTVLGRVLSKAP
ncbi:MAG: glycoside hydrolase [Oscillospiraceae bacterium]|jgi:hypothetical protein|nr:glycoside hydrolase [Oscillospiraceae bacterium]